MSCNKHDEEMVYHFMIQDAVDFIQLYGVDRVMDDIYSCYHLRMKRQDTQESANTTYYARIPKLIWEWIEVDALVGADVWEKYPTASDVLHWTEYEELKGKEQSD